MKKKTSSLLLISLLLFPLWSISMPKVYALDDIDYCISDIGDKVSSTLAQGSGWNITVSGSNCIFMNWSPIIDNTVYDSAGHVGPWTFGDNTSVLLGVIGDHPSDYESRAYIDWSITPMTTGINVTDVDVLLNFSSISDTFNFHNMTGDPVTSSASAVFNDTADGTEYLSTNFGGGSGFKTADLGTTADSELSTLRNASASRFGVGIHAFIQQSWSYIRSSESPGNNYPNILKVTYVIPSEDPGFGSLTLTSDQSSLFTSQSLTLTANYDYGGSGVSGLVITFQRSSDDSTWTNILNQTTDSLGNSFINYAQDEAGTYYFRAHYPGDSYSSANSSSVSILFNQIPGSSTPPGQTPTPTPTPPPSEPPPSPDPLTMIWCAIVDCGPSQEVSPAPPGEDIPEDIPTERPIEQLGTPGLISYESLDPITKALVDTFMAITGQDRSLLDTAEGIIEAVPEATVIISWSILLILLILLVGIAFFGKGAKIRGN